MTYEEFLEELKSFKWTYTTIGKRRLIRTGDDCCPIVAVFNKKHNMEYSSPLYGKAAKQLGLDNAILIACAADENYITIPFTEESKKEAAKIRQDLERVCRI